MIPTLLLRFWRPLTGALMIALAVGWVWRIDSLRAHWKAAYENEHKAYGIFRAQIIDKSAEALRQQKAVNAEWKEKSHAAAQISDATIGSLRADLRAARLRATASGRASGPPPAPGESDAPDVPGEVPTPSPDLSGQVLVDGDTLDALAAYSIAAHNWSKELVASGVGEYAPR